MNGAEWKNQQGEEEISYAREVLTHPANLYAFLGAASLGAVLSIPFGFGMGAIPLLFFGAGVALSFLFLPGSSSFRASVNARYRRTRREKSRDHLLEEISRRATENDPNWSVYDRMRDRIGSLQKIANNRRTSLASDDVERLDDATVDFLGLWLASLIMRERADNLDESDMQNKLENIERHMTALPRGADYRRLEKARNDLNRILTSHQRLQSKEIAVDAALLSMSETFEEIYQGVITNPLSGDVAHQLEAAVEKMRIEDELEMALESEDLANIIRPISAKNPRVRRRREVKTPISPRE